MERYLKIVEKYLDILKKHPECKRQILIELIFVLTKDKEIEKECVNEINKDDV